jgi:RNA polymerase sigma factor (sigma-70 family)
MHTMTNTMITLSERDVYIHHPSFDDPAAEGEILAPMPGATEYETKRTQMHVPSDVPPEMTALYQMPLLNREQEAHLFRAMNFRKHQVCRLVASKRRPSAEVRRQVVVLRAEADRLRNWLVQANLRLVVPFARQFAGQGHNFLDLLSEGNFSLFKAVDKFDFSRGFKFSTYASWALKRNFVRSLQKEQQHHDRFMTNVEDLQEHEASDADRTEATEDARRKVNRMLAALPPREQEILRQRAGLDDNGGEPATLEAIGKGLGISKERVRQLAQRALANLRKAFTPK